MIHLISGLHYTHQIFEKLDFEDQIVLTWITSKPRLSSSGNQNMGLIQQKE